MTNQVNSLTEALNKLNELSKLEKGWDGYKNTKPIPKTILDQTENYIKEIYSKIKDFSCYIIPTKQPGIQIEFDKNNLGVELDISENEIILFIDKCLTSDKVVNHITKLYK